LDNFFKRPIIIHHPTLGNIKSLEQPETIDIHGFLMSLRQIKRTWARTPFDQLKLTAEKSDPICIVVEGFLLFALSNDVTSMFDIRVFLDSTQTRCRMQRFRRQTKVDSAVPDSQVTITTNFSRWFDSLVWAEYLQRRDLQIANAEKVFKPEEYENNNYAILNAYICHRLEKMF
jgi:uridine kinase